MAKPLCIELTHGLYHVTSRGDRREASFRDAQDRAVWLALLAGVCERFNWRWLEAGGDCAYARQMLSSDA